MSKGDTYRHVNRAKYARGWLRIWGQACPECEGQDPVCRACKACTCPTCHGVGYVEKPRKGK